MKRLLILMVIAIVLVPMAVAQQMNLPRPSTKASVMQTVGLTDVTITYSRPGVKGRAIWGGLVPYDRVWRTGANEATTISFSNDVTVGGQKLEKGTYSLHTIPGREEWTLIFNREANQWGSYSYDESKDAVRLRVKPLEGPHKEWMTFSFPDVQPGSARVELAWEKVRVPFTIQVDTDAQAMKNIQDALARMTDWRIPYSAANYLINSNGDRAQALKWIDQSIGLKETYWNLRVRASLLAEAGKTKEAIGVAEKAVQIGKTNKDEPTEIEKTEALIAEWKR